MADIPIISYRSRKKHRRNMWIGLTLITLVLACVFYSYFTYADTSTTTLKIVHVVFRHGDRTPTETYPNDPYKNYNWPDGWGSLTNKGKSQLYQLGQTLRKHYSTFLTEHVSTNDLFVRSSDSDRCHMSGATLLAGMFPPSKNQIWNSDLAWQPIPIHSLPRSLDNIVAMKKNCQTYDKALADAYQSDEIKNLNENNKELFDYLTSVSGEDMHNITAVEFLYNTLEIEENHGLKLPDWTKKVYPGNMKFLAARSLAIFTETQFMRRMKGGVMLKEMLQNIKLKLEDSLKPNRKMFLYSAHDITLTNFMRTLGYEEYLKPDYGATFVLEAHATQAKDYEIKMLYYNSSSTSEPHILKMDSCGDPCYYENFLLATQHVIPENWEKECKN